MFNPLGHSKEFRRRRFLNWLPLGLMYSFYYMGRYNLARANAQISDTYGLSNADMGIIITAGFWVYAISFLINGPLTDRMGGRKGILAGAVGTMVVNVLMGLLIGFGFSWKIIFSFSMLYAANMYFQSFGAVSIVKVNAAWFHVRERGVFGGIFGILISLGYWLAYGVGALILAHLPLMWVFIIPALLIGLISIAGFLTIKDTPSQAGFQDFDTADASSGDQEEISVSYVLKKVFTTRVMLIIAMAELFTGFVRNGIMQWFPKYTDRLYGAGHTDFFGLGLFIVGILGGMSAGIVSDKFFDSRRPPVAGLCYIGMFVFLIILGILGSPAVMPTSPARDYYAAVTEPALAAAKDRDDIKAARVGLDAAAVKDIARETARQSGYADYDALPGAVRRNMEQVTGVESFSGKPKARVQVAFEQVKFLVGHESSWLYILSTLVALMVGFFFVGTHGLLSGTSSMDFGGKKAAGTAAGLIDGMVYLGSGVSGFFLGTMVDKYGWNLWAYLLVPGAVAGFILTLFIWNAKPKPKQG